MSRRPLWGLPTPSTGGQARGGPRSGACAAAVVAVLAIAVGGMAQGCTDCTLYAVAELNLRREPSLAAEVLRFVPAGAAVYRTSGTETNGYAPVTYDDAAGWVVALGLAAPAEGAGTPTASDDLRVTLAPLNLRSGPAVDAPTILILSEGVFVTLTGEGAENGYVAVDYDGTRGWASAEFLVEPAA